MSEEGAPRRSTRSITRRLSTETPSPPPLGGTPLKRARSSRASLLSSIAEAKVQANGGQKAQEENNENSSGVTNTKQQITSLSTVDSPKPKRGGRRSLLSEDVTLEPIRRSRRLSTGSEVSVDTVDDASRSSTPVQGAARRTRRLSIDSEDSTSAMTQKTLPVSVTPIVEAIQEEDINILSDQADNLFNNSKSGVKHTSIVEQFAVSHSAENESDPLKIEPENNSSLNKESDMSLESLNSTPAKAKITPVKANNIKPKTSPDEVDESTPKITPIKAKIEIKTSSLNSSKICEAFDITSTVDSKHYETLENNKLEHVIENVSPLEQLKVKSPISSPCNVEITVTDPSDKTKPFVENDVLNIADSSDEQSNDEFINPSQNRTPPKETNQSEQEHTDRTVEKLDNNSCVDTNTESNSPDSTTLMISVDSDDKASADCSDNEMIVEPYSGSPNKVELPAPVTEKDDVRVISNDADDKSKHIKSMEEDEKNIPIEELSIEKTVDEKLINTLNYSKKERLESSDAQLKVNEIVIIQNEESNVSGELKVCANKIEREDDLNKYNLSNGDIFVNVSKTPEKSDRPEKMCASTDSEHEELQELNASKESKELNTSKESKELNTSKESKELNASKELKELNTSNELKELNTSNYSEELNISNELMTDGKMISPDPNRPKKDAGVPLIAEIEVSINTEKEIGLLDAQKQEHDKSMSPKENLVVSNEVPIEISPHLEKVESPQKKSAEINLPSCDKDLELHIQEDEIENMNSHEQNICTPKKYDTKEVNDNNESSTSAISDKDTISLKSDIANFGDEDATISLKSDAISTDDNKDILISSKPDITNVAEKKDYSSKSDTSNETSAANDTFTGITNDMNKTTSKLNNPISNDVQQKTSNTAEKKTNVLVISDDSDIDSDGGKTKEYLKVNSDSDSSNYIDDEAEDMGEHYESHESMNEEEREAERENKILETGESIDSLSDAEDVSDEYEHDSFCIDSRSEDEQLLEGTSDDLDSRSSGSLSQSQTAKAKYNAKTKKKRRSRILNICSDSGEEEEGKHESSPASQNKMKEDKSISLESEMKSGSTNTDAKLNSFSIESDSDSSNCSATVNIKKQYAQVLEELNSQPKQNISAEESSKPEIISLVKNSPKSFILEKDSTNTNTKKVNLMKFNSNETILEEIEQVIFNVDQMNKASTPSKIVKLNGSFTLNKEELDRVHQNSEKCAHERDDVVSNVSDEKVTPKHLKIRSTITGNNSEELTCNKISFESKSGTLSDDLPISIDESESEVELRPVSSKVVCESNNLKEMQRRAESKSNTKKTKPKGEVDINNIDITKIQAVCDQIMQKEIEKKRIRRESDNSAKNKKIKRDELSKKLKRLPETVLEELDEPQEIILSKVPKIDTCEKASTSSDAKTRSLMDLTKDKKKSNQNSLNAEVHSNNKMAKLGGESLRKNKLLTKKIEQSSSPLQEKTSSEISVSKATNLRFGNEKLIKKDVRMQRIPKVASTSNFKITMTRQEKPSCRSENNFVVQKFKTNIKDKTTEGCTTIFQVEARRKDANKEVIVPVSTDLSSFKQNIFNDRIHRLEKGKIYAYKNKQKAIASRK